MGASTGGIETFMQIVSALPRHVPAAIFVVLHVAPRGTTKFPEILTRAGHLPAAHAVDNEPIQPGRMWFSLERSTTGPQGSRRSKNAAASPSSKIPRIRYFPTCRGTLLST
jgi:chemotaxis response regulator CheB